MKPGNRNDKENIPKSAFLRKKILDIIYQAQASHIAPSFSIVEILLAVYRSVDIKRIKNKREDRDRVILSKGHSVAALYATLNHFGLLSNKELGNYYKNGSLLIGHVNHNVPHIEHSTGALGHGLSVALGISLGLKARKIGSRVYVIVGDGELHEGSNWEAFMLAGYLRPDNLCVLIDYNKMSGIGRVDSCCKLEPLKSKLESFGFDVFEVNGHTEAEIYSAIQKTKKRERLSAIICHTIKGKGVSFMENNNVWHYRPPNREEYEKAVYEITGGNS